MPETGTCTSIINLRYQDGSEGSPSNPARFNNQDYAQLKRNSLRKGQLFVDSSFPPDLSSLGDLQGEELEVTWLRPADILEAQETSETPVFLHEGASRFDFGQGTVSNCWFLSAISALTFQQKLLVQVVPMNQTFDKDYAGIFHFRFWRFGKWVDVVIDDHLPTRNNELLSVNCKGSNEFWAPLLEKAYAKVCGSYADMNYGWSTDAFKDFSGGVSMMYDLMQLSLTCEELWLSLSRATLCKSMICCSTYSNKDSSEDSVSHTGLVYNHAYSVTGVTEVTYKETGEQKKEKLVRVMNPWGEQEWDGQWSDNSDMWQRVSPEDREKCRVHEDGEFWISLEDLCHTFRMLFICCENPNFIDGDLTCQWKCMSYDGRWVAEDNTDSFATNPQYRVQVTTINKQERNDHNVLLSLMQIPQERNRKQQEYYLMELHVFKVPPGTPRGRLPSSFFEEHSVLPHQSADHLSLRDERELVEVYSLEPGEYVIVPSATDVETDTEFVLSVYTKADAKPEEENISDLFRFYADQNGQLSHRQLQKLLNDIFPHGDFDLYTCRSMIAMVDQDQRMTMTFSEFSALWKKIEEYINLFLRSDTNQSGALSDQEFQNAVKAAGMDVNDSMVPKIIYRYSDSGSTTLENFISLMVRLDKMSLVFNNKSSDGKITFTKDEWADTFMYN